MTQGLSGMMGQMPSRDMMNAMREKMFAKADGDGNGQVSKAEMQELGKSMSADKAGGAQPDQAKFDKMFSSMDGDGDGNLSKTEMSSFEPKMNSDMMSTIFSMLQGEESSGTQESETQSAEQQALTLLTGGSNKSSNKTDSQNDLTKMLLDAFETSQKEQSRETVSLAA
jgi:Ca2+-binding EF-hand superfamily protein